MEPGTDPGHDWGMSLSDKQQRFVQEYLIDLNATQAAIRAGYSVVAAPVTASRLLRNANVKEAIKKGQDKTAADNELSVEWVLTMLKQNAQRAMQVIPVTDAQGNPTGEYRYEGNVANKALELLGKHQGMFADRVKVEGGEKPVEFKDMTPVDRAEALAKLITQVAARAKPDDHT